MAPIEIDTTNSKVEPAVLFAGYLTTSLSLTSVIVRTLQQAFVVLPPSQATPSRRKHVQIFSALSMLSLSVVWYYVFAFFTLTYRVWASERGVDMLNGGFWNGAWLTDLELSRWLRDTPIFTDMWEIALERSSRFWWSQQLFLGGAAWAVLR